MAGDDEQAMSSERLAEIRARAGNLAEVRQVGPHDFSDLEPSQLFVIAMAYHEDIPALLAEVERQRAREKPLLTLLRAVAKGEPLHENFMWQARGWLQAEEEQRSGGDGA